ncbi:MAG: xanthine dehydrogenase family protein molybdopterin-binding subunit [Pseudomonadota bacterium]
MSSSWIGKSVKRLEDPALLTGRGQFVDDIHIPGTLHAAFVRSPHAHARIANIDKSGALSFAGVHAVYTFEDLPDALTARPLPELQPNSLMRAAVMPFALARDEVCHVGAPVAVVLADDRYIAEDALEHIVVDYEVLPAAVDVFDAAEPGAATAHAHLDDNLAADIRIGYGDADAAFMNPHLIIDERFVQHRGTAHPIECRAVQAQFDELTDTMRLWANTQTPHLYKAAYADLMDVPEQNVMVIAPDVGGGFGPKVMLYPEQLVVPACALLTGRPVKWTEDRREHFITATMERDQHWRGELAVDADGTIRGLRAEMLHDMGAHAMWGIVTPWISCTTVPGPYVLPSYQMHCRVVMTNKVAVTPVRGAGRPQAAYFIERLLDRAADALGLGRDEIRRRNYVQPEQMPYEVGLIFRDGRPVVYDTGDYPELARLALEKSDWAGFRERQRAARAEGRYLGIGVASYIEATGLGPFEGTSVHVLPSGRVAVHTGAAPQGQGHQTMLAQVVADALGARLEDITVKTSDTVTIPRGVGTFASRITPNASPAAHEAGLSVKTKIRKVASHMLEAAEEDLEVEDGRVFIRGVREHGKTFAEIAKFANALPGFALPKGLDPVLQDTVYFAPEQATYPCGTHVAEVEVDPALGAVRILRYVTAHDCGTIINPVSVEAQVMGGVAHGVGNALLERMVYDDAGQPLTVNFGEYLLPSAPEVPCVEQTHMESPTPLNPLGAKGAGEGGTIPAIAVIVSAIEDALAPFDVQINDVPVTPDRLLALIDESTEESH